MLSTVKKYEIRHFLRYKKNHTVIINFKKTPLLQKKRPINSPKNSIFFRSKKNIVS